MSRFSFVKSSGRNGSRRASRQRGASIISVLLGLVITAAVVAVIYNQYTDSQRKARVEAAQAEIASMIAAAQKLYGNVNQYGAVTTAIAVQSGVIPARLRVGTTSTAQNLYNGPITFAPATITTASDSLTLGYGAVRKEDCQDLVLGSAGLVRSATVGTTSVKPADQPVVLATLGTACDAAASSAINLTFGRGQ